MAKAFDPMALVAGAAKKKEKKASKSKTPVVEVTDPKVITAMAAWKAAKEQEKDAKAERGMAEEIILPLSKEERRKLIQEGNAHLTSIKLKSEDTQMTMKTSKAYSNIPTDAEDELREIFGDDYDRLFSTHTSIAFNDRSAVDPEVLKKVISAVGADKFAEIFDVEQSIKPSEVLIVERDMNVKVAEKHDQAVEEGLIKPFKPAFTL